MTTLYRATDSHYARKGKPGAFTWWTPDKEWALGYGSTIIERDDEGLNILRLPLDGYKVERALQRAGIETDGIDFDDADNGLEYEVHQILVYFGDELADRLAAAGYDAVEHPDHNDNIGGIGTAIAIITE